VEKHDTRFIAVNGISGKMVRGANATRRVFTFLMIKLLSIEATGQEL
jgi:hypothetical protein